MSDGGRLRCNRCWQVLTGQFAWITACSHIFCEEDATKSFSRQSICPCCSSNIDRDSELKRIRTDLDEAPSMALWGSSPTLIFEACAGALGFFIYQKKQEFAWMNHIMGQKEKQAQAAQASMQHLLQERDEHIRHLSEKVNQCLEEMQHKDTAYMELKKSNKEKTRMCKNYEKLYNKMQIVNSKARRSPNSSPMSPQCRLSHVEPPAPQTQKQFPESLPTNLSRQPLGSENFSGALTSSAKLNSSRASANHKPSLFPESLSRSRQPSLGESSHSSTIKLPANLCPGLMGHIKSLDNNSHSPHFSGRSKIGSSKIGSAQATKTFTPQSLGILGTLGKGLQKTNNKESLHPLNTQSPHTPRRMNCTPANILPTPSSLFGSAKPSIYSRFRNHRR